jgi:hypothetical protein
MKKQKLSIPVVGSDKERVKIEAERVTGGTSEIIFASEDGVIDLVDMMRRHFEEMRMTPWECRECEKGKVPQPVVRGPPILTISLDSIIKTQKDALVKVRDRVVCPTAELDLKVCETEIIGGGKA